MTASVLGRRAAPAPQARELARLEAQADFAQRSQEPKARPQPLPRSLVKSVTVEQAGEDRAAGVPTRKCREQAIRVENSSIESKTTGAAVAPGFPGGFGTLDELFEVLTLVQTRKVKRVPIVLFGKDYWSRLLNLQMLVDEGAIAAEDLQLYDVVDEPAEAWEVIRRFYDL